MVPSRPVQGRRVIAHPPEPRVPGHGALVGRVNHQRVLIEIPPFQLGQDPAHAGVDRRDLSRQVPPRLEIPDQVVLVPLPGMNLFRTRK